MPEVRVGLLVQVTDAQIGAPAVFALRDDDGIVIVGSADELFSVRREGDGLLVYTPGGDLVDSVKGTLAVEPRSEIGEVAVNGARYPGRLEIVLSPKGGFNVVNAVDVETYLRGVVPLEIGHRDGGLLEAAKAQAVAARTYVAAHLGQYPDEGFDLFAGITDQVYGPLDRRHPNADRAVRETRGLILEYEGKPIRANYASTCGGRTAGVEESFDSEPIPYLESHPDRVNGQVPCRSSRFFRWEETWTGEELRRVLSQTVPRVLNRPWQGRIIRDLEVVERGKSDRVVVLRVTSDREALEITKGQIRQVFESTEGRPLRSTAFELQVWRRGERIRMIVAQGRGWGHGVGMCQWGAMQLSRDGHTFREILRHYYPGTELRVWYPPEALSLRHREAIPGGHGGRPHG
jgi:stage II sporulation protein D